MNITELPRAEKPSGCGWHDLYKITLIQACCFARLANGVQGGYVKRVGPKLLIALSVVSLFGASLLLPAPAQAKSRPQAFRTLTGHVFSKDNKPVSQAVVYLKNTKTHLIENYISDPDGSYHFPWLSLAVDYELHAEFQGASSDTKIISSFDNRKQLDIVLRLR